MYSIEQRDEQLVSTTADIVYELSFDRAAQHLVGVSMRVTNVKGSTLTCVMPSWAPGSYKIRDYAGYQGNVRAWRIVDGKREPAVSRWRDKASLEITTGGASEIHLDYVVYGLERTVRTNHINRWHAFLMPVATLMYVEGRTEEIHHVLLKHDTNRWPNVSTQLSPVYPGGTPGPGLLLGALNYDILADSPIEIGDHVVRKFTAAGAEHELALVGPYSLDDRWLTEQLKIIVDTEAKLFGGVPYDRYVFIVQAYPGAGGGLEHTRSSVNAVDPSALLDKTKGIDLLSLLCHEYFHLWNVKRIRPVELGPFDYRHEAYTPMLWLAEGMTSYYDDLLTYRCGFTTETEYIAQLGRDHVSRLMRVPGRRQMSVRDSSLLAWLKLYMQSPDANNRFPSYYLKGGVIFLLLDIYIIDHTDGKKRLDDGLRTLWANYQASPDKGLTEADCIALLERGTGVQLRELLMTWLDGTDELPYDEILGAVGMRLSIEDKRAEAITFGENRTFASVPVTLFCGWSCREEGGRIVVKAVEDGSPAAQAGIGIDDEIIAVHGKRVTSVTQLDQYVAEPGGGAVQITAQCDGRIYATTLDPDYQKVYKLVDVATPSERQKTIRRTWLAK
ncbi:MAG: M61 family metallopeptidase ['Candidatus Kapabacteria' thiocyanatum]|uniref:PDZ domain-containing protein n=1 Tax=Candidatus Kapaibacterium thiocyanatum TaxID=1895771 RepID=A0A1M3KZH6_9BACT|nr:M61 family metallopeptidase ['Candidatus Kapabacteria' thiocyanatum]OJX57780.1 MAG: hypothetical protein BGO89_07360 ['Candidatus Kapabacteria' thiocyanatum]